MRHDSESILDVIQRKGLLESFLYGISKLITKIYSAVASFSLRLRGYDIDRTVLLKGDNFFFQSKKHSIHISANTTIGKHTRISCGGSGRIIIEENVLLDDYVYIMAHEKIVIRKNTKIAAFSFITDFNHVFQDKNIPIRNQGYATKPIDIGDNVWVGTHAVILNGVTIGNSAVIGAGSIVTNNIAENRVAVGNPAKMIEKS